MGVVECSPGRSFRKDWSGKINMGSDKLIECSPESYLFSFDGETLTYYSEKIHELNKKWWMDLETGQYPIHRNVGEMIALVHSELSEALEGHRKNLMDDHLPHRKMIEVELADAVIRIMDLAYGLGLDLGGAWFEKLKYNQTREDHQIDARKSPNGKRY